ncbi:MAG: sigma-70 family RNA polymerase sigma factor [Planctomycetota bacterium]
MSNSSATHRLLESAIGGDADSLNQLLRKYQSRLKNMIAVRMNPRLQSRVDASDIVQDALLEAATRLDGYSSSLQVPFYPWLRQIAMQRMIDVTRKHLAADARDINRERRFTTQEDVSVAYLVDRLVTDASSPTQQVRREEAKQRVQLALDSLAEVDREVLVMRYVEQMPTSEIAIVLEISERAVRKRHRKALDRLLEELDE